jgi:prophage DNA circulation protein
MSWRERLRPASIDNVPFFVEGAELGFGPRKQITEYPQRDDVTGEGFGKGKHSHRIDAFVLGENCFDARDALIDVLEKEGQRILIHPYFGRLTVDILDDCSCTHSSQKGGYVKITFTAVKTGISLKNTSIEDTTAITLAAIEAAGASVSAQFALDYNMSDKPAFLAVSALDVLGKGLTALRNVNGRLSALQTSNAVDTALSSYQNVNTSMNALPAVSGSTPHRLQQAKNQQAMQTMINSHTLLGTLANITQASEIENANINESPFNSYQHAISVKNALLTALDAQAALANDDAYAAIVVARAAFTRHIDRHGVNLMRVVTYTPKRSLPALVLAYQLYGDATYDADIITRNNIEHPLFVPVMALEVLDA